MSRISLYKRITTNRLQILLIGDITKRFSEFKTRCYLKWNGIRELSYLFDISMIYYENGKFQDIKAVRWKCIEACLAKIIIPKKQFFTARKKLQAKIYQAFPVSVLRTTNNKGVQETRVASFDQDTRERSMNSSRSPSCVLLTYNRWR